MVNRVNSIKVLVVDDHILYREGLRSVLGDRSDIELIGEAKNKDEAISKIKELRPDVVLFSISPPSVRGLDHIKQIKKCNPETNILILTLQEGESFFFDILKAGSSGYFIKGGSCSELISAIHTVYEGHVFLYHSIANKLLRYYLEPRNARVNFDNYINLTEREKEILILLAEDHSNREIAKMLNLSPATVQTHRAKIMSKLRLHSRSKLTKYAISRGLINLDL